MATGHDQGGSGGMSLKPWTMIWDMGWIISVPLVGLALSGRLLDRYLATTPLFLLIGALSAIVISTIIVCKRISQLLE